MDRSSEERHAHAATAARRRPGGALAHPRQGLSFAATPAGPGTSVERDEKALE